MTRFTYTHVLWMLCGWLVLATSCEDPIDVTLDQGEAQVTVDAFINSAVETQTIRLTMTGGYFDNVPNNGVTDGAVKVIDQNGNEFPFVHQSDGFYTWTPDTVGPYMDQVETAYTLEITANGQTYQAISILNPVPPIDSVTYEFEEAELGQPEGYYAQFWGRDFAGRTDFYWVKTFKNGVFDADPGNITIAYDAAFGEGADGFVFITPIREGITPFDEPYELGDTVNVELHAINEGTWNFIQEMQTQMVNGGLFATPPANVRTNLENTDASSSTKAIGYFDISSVSRGGSIMGQ